MIDGLTELGNRWVNKCHERCRKGLNRQVIFHAICIASPNRLYDQSLFQWSEPNVSSGFKTRLCTFHANHSVCRDLEFAVCASFACETPRRAYFALFWTEHRPAVLRRRVDYVKTPGALRHRSSFRCFSLKPKWSHGVAELLSNKWFFHESHSFCHEVGMKPPKRLIIFLYSWWKQHTAVYSKFYFSLGAMDFLALIGDFLHSGGYGQRLG